MNFKLFSIKSEYEVNRNYPDLLIVPKDITKGYKSIMLEFKYIKKGEKSKLREKQKEAKEQLLRYCEFEDIKCIEGLRKYSIVALNDKIYIEEIY